MGLFDRIKREITGELPPRPIAPPVARATAPPTRAAQPPVTPAASSSTGAPKSPAAKKCPVCTGLLPKRKAYHQESVCLECAYQALIWEETFDAPLVARSVILHLGESCFICGEAPIERAALLQTASNGGHERWMNVGGACKSCTSRKGAKELDITPEMQTRLDKQRDKMRTARERALKARDKALVSTALEDWPKPWSSEYDRDDDLETELATIVASSLYGVAEDTGTSLADTGIAPLKLRALALANAEALIKAANVTKHATPASFIKELAYYLDDEITNCTTDWARDSLR